MFQGIFKVENAVNIIFIHVTAIAKIKKALLSSLDNSFNKTMALSYCPDSTY